MNAEKSRMGSRASVWVLSLLAVPVLYLLSLPVLWAWFGEPGTHSYIAASRSGAHYGKTWAFNKPIPAWLRVYSAPGDWIGENTALKGPLMAYRDWVFERMSK